MGGARPGRGARGPGAGRVAAQPVGVGHARTSTSRSSAAWCTPARAACATATPYVSDSNGYWRFERLPEVLAAGAHERLHVLTHPEWWQEEAMSPRERILRCIAGRARRRGDRHDPLQRLLAIELDAEPIRRP